MTEPRDPGYSRPFTTSTSTTIPQLIEVEEHGHTRLVLMQKRSVVRHYPARTYMKVVSPVGLKNFVAAMEPGPDGKFIGSTVEIVVEQVHEPAETWGEAHWERA